MCDTIYRQDAIDAHCEMCPDRHICCPVRSGNICPEFEVFSLLPSAQQQQKKGHWINDCTCSVCHWIHEDYEGFALITNYRYCPRCGARMDGESDEML